ncbi:MAG: PPOX class F420-dependent oxidoreductase [Actinomycetota bacterium]|nr:PPOX class F420-dependent oxidoreductase [Actinomycetota bacterium]
MTVAKRLERFYDRVRSSRAVRAAEGETTTGFSHLRGRKYAVLVTYRRSGEPVPTPVWFGLDERGRVYTRSLADAWKVKRVRHDPRARVAPCDARGKPLGPAAEGRVRIVPAEEEAHAEEAIQANYGLGRKLYEAASVGRVDLVYLEVTAA